MDASGSSGEFEFIRKIQSMFASSPNVIQSGGDDCAVLRVGNRIQVISTDAFVQDIHFNLDWASPHDVGWKAVAAALSDIAAMGAQPQFILTSLAAPKSWPNDDLMGMYEGIQEAASAFEAVVIGGDTTRSPAALMMDVTVIGEAVDGHYLLRKGAKAGDVLLMTGKPGRSRAGLLALENKIDAPDAIRAHHRPVPRIEAGLWLAKSLYVNAMMDVSDGLAQDAGHLAQAAGLGVDLDSQKITEDDALRPVCEALDMSMSEIIFTGGEDYELAMAVAPENVEAVIHGLEENFDLPVHAIGTFSDSFEGVRIDGVAVDGKGYDHFRN